MNLMVRGLFAFAALAFLLAPSSFSADDPTRVYFVQRSVTGTANSVVFRQPSSNKRALQLKGVYFSCSVACTFAVTKNGTPSGGSSGASSIQTLDDRAPASAFTATLDPSVSSDTTVITNTLAAGGSITLSGGLYLPVVSGSQKQIKVAITSGSSGDLYIYAVVAEPQ